MIKPNITTKEEQEILEGLLEQSIVETPVNTSEPCVESFDDYYRLYNVGCNGFWWNVDMTKEPLYNNETDNLEGWLQKTKNMVWKIASTKLYFAFMSALYDNRTHSTQQPLINEVRQVLENDFTNNYWITCTMINYAKKKGLLGKQKSDQITHMNPLINNTQNMVGYNGPIDNTNFKDQIYALLGTKDRDYVSKVLEWVSGKKPYLHCLKTRSNTKIKSTVALGGLRDNGWFNIPAICDYNDPFPARGWRIMEVR